MLLLRQHIAPASFLSAISVTALLLLVCGPLLLLTPGSVVAEQQKLGPTCAASSLLPLTAAQSVQASQLLHTPSILTVLDTDATNGLLLVYFAGNVDPGSGGYDATDTSNGPIDSNVDLSAVAALVAAMRTAVVNVALLPQNNSAFPITDGPCLNNSDPNVQLVTNSGSSNTSGGVNMTTQTVVAGGLALDAVDFVGTYFPARRPVKSQGLALQLSGLESNTTYVVEVRIVLPISQSNLPLTKGPVNPSSTNPTIVWWRTMLQTRVATSPCVLASNLTYCPRLAYATAATPIVSDNIDSGMGGFNFTLSQFNCRSVRYSHVRNCTDCVEAYRDWLCAVTFPRCVPPGLENRFLGLNYSATNSLININSLTLVNVGQGSNSGKPISAAVAANYANLNVANVSSPYVAQPELSTLFIDYSNLTGAPLALPCKEVCFNVMQSCPSFFSFICPSPEGVRIAISRDSPPWRIRDYGVNSGQCNRMGLINQPSAASARDGHLMYQLLIYVSGSVLVSLLGASVSILPL